MLRWLAVTMLACGAVALSAQTAAIDPALLAKASGGDAAAQVQVGEQYAKAAETAQFRDQAAGDWTQAVAWYRKAAGQNNLAGEIHLAELYRDGGGKAFPRDMTQAAAWYRKAAEQGDIAAQGALGMLYSLGQGVPQDDAEAYFWLDLAASAPGPRQAQYMANRQNVGTRITQDQLDEIREREAKWKAAHPAPAAR
ncbi:MAG: tetratricopeptide repeat protein [Acidobacteriota bacterium]